MDHVGVRGVCRWAVWLAWAPALPSLHSMPCSVAPAALSSGKTSEGAQDLVQLRFTPFCNKKPAGAPNTLFISTVAAAPALPRADLLPRWKVMVSSVSPSQSWHPSRATGEVQGAELRGSSPLGPTQLRRRQGAG